MFIRKINHFIDLWFVQKVCFLAKKKDSMKYTKGSERGNEETQTEIQMKKKREREGAVER